MTVEIVAYLSFDEDWQKLSPDAKKRLGQFLVRLKQNPYDPRLLGAAELSGDAQYAFEFSKGFAIYWRVEIIPELSDISLEWASIQVMLNGIRSLQ